MGNDKLDPERQSIYPRKEKLVQRFRGYLGEAEGVKKRKEKWQILPVQNYANGKGDTEREEGQRRQVMWHRKRNMTRYS